MTRLLLLPYLLTSLGVYTVCAVGMYQAQDVARGLKLAAVLWYAITITGLVVALAAKEW